MGVMSRRTIAKEMADAIEDGIREACPDNTEREALCAQVRALVVELTKDDEPVFRSALGNWGRYGK